MERGDEPGQLPRFPDPNVASHRRAPRTTDPSQRLLVVRTQSRDCTQVENCPSTVASTRLDEHCRFWPTFDERIPATLLPHGSIQWVARSRLPTVAVPNGARRNICKWRRHVRSPTALGRGFVLSSQLPRDVGARVQAAGLNDDDRFQYPAGCPRGRRPV
jgi:hypothetical protein